MNKHAVSIKWSDEDNGFIASIPGTQALSAFGNTREIALSELKIAAEAYFTSLKKAGKTIPPEDKVISFSGQIRLRMSKSLHAALSNVLLLIIKPGHIVIFTLRRAGYLLDALVSKSAYRAIPLQNRIFLSRSF